MPVLNPQARARFLAARRRAQTKDAELDCAQEAYLRACGWAHTCDAPGAVWLWARPYQGRVLLVPREFAVLMQDHIDSGVYPADGESRDSLERMGEDMHPAFAPETRIPLAHGATATTPSGATLTVESGE